MSKPYFKINSATYSSSLLTINYTFWRNRGSVLGGSDLTVTGISSTSSLSFYEPNIYNLGGKTKSIQVVNLQGGSGATYVDPAAIVWTFSGTPSTTTNAKLTIDNTILGSTQLSSVTSSNSNLATFLSSIASSIVGNSSGVSAVSTSTTLTVSVPNTGNKYNNKALTINLTKGSGGSTIVGTSNQGLTNSGTFSGGVTNFSIGLSTFRGGYDQEYTVSSSTFSLIP